MLKIGDFSKVAQVSVKTLRYYDELKLLRAAWVDRYTGYRYYTLQQLPRLNRILALRELGFSLVQIERLLRDDLPASELQRLMQLRHAELAEQVQAEQARLARVAARLRQIEQEGRLPRYEVLVKRVEPRLVAGIRDTIAGYEDIGALFAEINDHLAGHNAAALPGMPYMALYYDAEYREQGIDVEAAVPISPALRVSHALASRGRVQIHELPALDEAASVVHTGAYSSVSAAYRALMAWSQTHGYRLGGPSRELYLQGGAAAPAGGADPSTFVTELQLPIAQRTAQVTNSGQEKDAMEPKIVTKPAFTVVGLPFQGYISQGPYADGANNNEIGVVWDELNRRAAEIKHFTGPAYGVCFGMPNPDEPWYLAGFGVSEATDVPPGMMSLTVPAQKYAVFACTLGELSQTYRHISEEWQPQSGYERAEAPDFELYGEDFDPMDAQHGKMYVYWPIR